MDESEMTQRVSQARVGRLATVRADGTPHVVPCCFALFEGSIVSAVDAKPKSTLELQRLANIAARPAASLVVDHYEDDWTQLWWIRVDGEARTLTDVGRRERALDTLAEKYPQYIADRPPGAVIEVIATRWRSWP